MTLPHLIGGARTTTSLLDYQPGWGVPGPADVEVQFGNLTRAYTVRGASGTLTFGVRADGRASGKLVVYRQLGTSTPIRLPDGLPPHVMM